MTSLCSERETDRERDRERERERERDTETERDRDTEREKDMGGEGVSKAAPPHGKGCNCRLMFLHFKDISCTKFHTQLASCLDKMLHII